MADGGGSGAELSLGEMSDAIDGVNQSSISEAEAASETEGGKHAADGEYVPEAGDEGARTLIGTTVRTAPEATLDSGAGAGGVDLTPVAPSVYMSRLERARKANAARRG